MRDGKVLLKAINYMVFFLFLFSASQSSFAVNWDNRDEATEVLAKCNAVYGYLAHYSMLSGNEPAAKNFIANSAVMFSGLMFLNREGEKIKGERLAFIKAAREGLREQYDVDINLAFERADLCRPALPEVIREFGKAPSLFGKSFMEFREHIMKKFGLAIGITY